MRAPLRFATRNLLFPRSLDEAWALYRLDTVSYEGLTSPEKLALLSTIARFAYAIGADFSIYRVSRAWSPADYEQRAKRWADAVWQSWSDQHDIVRQTLEASTKP